MLFSVIFLFWPQFLSQNDASQVLGYVKQPFPFKYIDFAIYFEDKFLPHNVFIVWVTDGV